MKKSIRILALTLVAILCFSSGVFAKNDSVDIDNRNSNEINITDDFKNEMNLNAKIDEFINDFLNAISGDYDKYGFSETEINNLQIGGIYKTIDTRNESGYKVATYNVILKSNEEFKAIVKLFYKEDGVMEAEFSKSYSDKLQEYYEKNESIILAHDNLGTFALSENNTKDYIERAALESDITAKASTLSEIGAADYNALQQYAVEYKSEDITFVESSGKNVVNSKGRSDENKKLLENNNYFFNNMTDEDMQKAFGGSYDIGISLMAVSNLRLVPQGNSWCNNASVACVVSARLPSQYGSLTAAEVMQNVGVGLLSPGGMSYIKNHVDKYLPSSNGHYTSYSSSPIDIQQYINNCNANHLIIGITRREYDFYHACVFYDYISRTGGGVLVQMMDPFEPAWKLCTWISGTFSYNFIGYNYYMTDVIVNYY